MHPWFQIAREDSALIRIVDRALEEAAHRSGDWLACRPGCTECCYGPFEISQLDAERLRRGLGELETRDRERADRVRQRARAAAADGFGDDDPCPALDPSGTCDLYAWRPMTCRVFGPAVRYGPGGVSACELCYRGASDEEITACAVDIDPGNTEAALNGEWERLSGSSGPTTVAECLA